MKRPYSLAAGQLGGHALVWTCHDYIRQEKQMGPRLCSGLAAHSAGLLGGGGGESVEEFVRKSKLEWRGGVREEEGPHSREY